MTARIQVAVLSPESVEDLHQWLDVLKAIGVAPESTSVEVSFGNLIAAIAIEDLDLSRIELDA